MRNLILLFLCSAMLLPPNTMADSVGKVIKLIGSADLTRENNPARALSLNDEVEKLDVVRTKRRSLLVLQMNDGSKITLDENSRIVISEYKTGETPSGLFEITRGKMRAIVSETFSRRKESFRTRSRTAIAGVQGTDFEVHAYAVETEVLVHEGLVAVRNLDPSIRGLELLRAGTAALVKASSPPVLTKPKVKVIDRESENKGSVQVNSGTSQDLRSGGTQSADPTTLAPKRVTRIPLPPELNLP